MARSIVNWILVSVMCLCATGAVAVGWEGEFMGLMARQVSGVLVIVTALAYLALVGQRVIREQEERQ